MITVIPTSPPGTTEGIESLIKLIQDNPKQFICLIQIERANYTGDTKEYVFIALFREKNTLGQFVAFINEWGANFGKKAGGYGSYGYRQIQSFVEDHNIVPMVIVWDSVESELRSKLDNSTPPLARFNAWQEFLVGLLCHIMPDYLEATEYPLTKRWSTNE